jgi:hypothetical protein
MGPTPSLFFFPLSFFLSTDSSHQFPIHPCATPPPVQLLPTGAAHLPHGSERRKQRPGSPAPWRRTAPRGARSPADPPVRRAWRSSSGPSSSHLRRTSSTSRRDPTLVAGAPRPPSPSAEISELPRRQWRLPLSAVAASLAGTSSPPLLFSLCEASVQLHERGDGAAMADGCDGVLRRPRRVVGMARERVGHPSVFSEIFSYFFMVSPACNPSVYCF